MNISDYKLDVIRQVCREIIHCDNGEFQIQGKHFKEFQYDCVLTFGSYSAVNRFIIETLLKDLE